MSPHGLNARSRRPVLTRALIRHLRAQFALDWKGIHGAPHWARVRYNGLYLARRTGARADVVELFAFLHDARRLDDHADPFHGKRAADFAESLRDRFFELDDTGFELLRSACIDHSGGRMSADITVMTCWDADRLDLGRVGIKPVPARLCTAAERDEAMIEWAWRRSIRDMAWEEPESALHENEPWRAALVQSWSSRFRCSRAD